MSTFRMLLVDDEIEVLTALEKTLAPDGYEIFTASDAEAAIEVLDTEPVDLVITDQRMPSMTGTDFLQIVKHRYPWILRMVLTGYADSGTAREAYEEAGALRVLVKPWDEAYLRGVVRTARRYLERDETAANNREAEGVNFDLLSTSDVVYTECRSRESEASLAEEHPHSGKKS